jgi:hypothetical protein
MTDKPVNLFATCDTTESAMSLSHATCNVVSTKAGDDEQINVKVVQTVANFVYLHDYSNIFKQFAE